MQEMQKLTLEELTMKVEHIPELPQVALRVSRMMEDPNTSAHQLAEVIRLDPNMTGQVLRLCNSAAYGLSRKVETVKDAVALLGFKTLKSLVYTVISHSALNRNVQGYQTDKGSLWINSLTCATYAKFLAENFIEVDPELAFTGGLLRDIGKIILGEYVGANYQKIEALAVEQQLDFVQAEEKVIGYSHTAVGMEVARKWNLPEKLIKVIGYHHKPSELLKNADNPVDFQLVTTIHLADVLTMIVGTGMGTDGMMYTLDETALKESGVNLEDGTLDIVLSRVIDLSETVKDLSGAFV